MDVLGGCREVAMQLFFVFRMLWVVASHWYVVAKVFWALARALPYATV